MYFFEQLCDQDDKILTIEQATCKYQRSQLISWCFELSQPQRITSGLNTNFSLSPSYSFHKSSYHKSCFFQPIHIPPAFNTGTCIQQGDIFYFADLHRNRCYPQPTQEKNRERFWKKCSEWTGRVEISKEKIPGSKRSILSVVAHRYSKCIDKGTASINLL